MTPLDVTPRDIEIISQKLLNRRLNGHLECLEWGVGGSTLYFPRLLEKHGVPYRWLAIEHDPKWIRDVAAHGRPENVSFALFETANPRLEPMIGYVDYPLSVGRRFDFVFVDGRKRRRCLLTASKVTAPGGVVILHDAKREYYHSSFAEFTHGERVGDDLWIGRIDSV